MAREIPLTRGKVALVDDADYDRIAPHKWVARPSDQSAERWYAYRSQAIPGSPKTLYMHRSVLLAPAHLLVDHVNGDGLDNRRSNLRLATHGGNVINRECPNSTGYRGVRAEGSRYWAQIEVAGTVVRVRGCPSAEVAARAYDALAREFQGEFAHLNFPTADRRIAR